MNLTDILDTSEVSKVPGVSRKIVNNGKVTFESQHRRSDGTTFPVEVYIKPMTYYGKEAIIIITRDVTKQEEYEQELLRAKNAAEKASFEKSQSMNIASHELRTPLNSIQGNVE